MHANQPSNLSCTVNGTGLERVRYFPRQLLTAEDMLAEQRYFRMKSRRHNRFLHGWGVVCGLKVTAAPNAQVPWRVHVAPGFALSCGGDEIYLAHEECFDLAKCLASIHNPCDENQATVVIPQTLYLAVRYQECYALPIRVVPLGCACDDLPCEYSRTRESFELGCLDENNQPGPAPLCADPLPDCPNCPDTPACEWVVLARIDLPKNLKDPIADAEIHNMVRRRVYSTAQIQHQVMECCCKPTLLVEKRGERNGGRGTFTITVTNIGTGSAHQVVVKEKAPPAPASFQPPAQDGWKVTGSTLTAEIGTLAPGESATRSYTLRVGEPAITRIATVTCVPPDSTGQPHTATATL